jgi:hypothetical protein
MLSNKSWHVWHAARAGKTARVRRTTREAAAESVLSCIVV